MMKKKILLPFLLLVLSFNVSALDFKWDFGTAFIGGKLGYDGSPGPALELDLQCVDLRLESDLGFLFAYSPFNVWAVLNNPAQGDSQLMTFGNFTLGYDLFRFRKDFELIPYLSAYTCALEGMDKFRFDLGLIFNLYADDIFWPDEVNAAEENYHLRGEILAAKLGVRLNRGQPQVYGNFGLNLLALGMMISQKP